MKERESINPKIRSFTRTTETYIQTNTHRVKGRVRVYVHVHIYIHTHTYTHTHTHTYTHTHIHTHTYTPPKQTYLMIGYWVESSEDPKSRNEFSFFLCSLFILLLTFKRKRQNSEILFHAFKNIMIKNITLHSFLLKEVFLTTEKKFKIFPCVRKNTKKMKRFQTLTAICSLLSTNPLSMTNLFLFSLSSNLLLYILITFILLNCLY